MKVTHHKNGTYSLSDLGRDDLNRLALGLGFLSCTYSKEIETGHTSWGESLDAWGYDYSREQLRKAGTLETALRDAGNTWQASVPTMTLAKGRSIVLDEHYHVTEDGRTVLPAYA